MAHQLTEHWNVHSPSDVGSTASKSIDGNDHSWRDHARTYSIDSRDRASRSVLLIEESSSNRYKNLPGAMPISMNQVLKAQNSNAPWLFDVLKRKFSRSRKSKIDSSATAGHPSVSVADQVLGTLISHDGTSGQWTIDERDLVVPLTKVRKYCLSLETRASSSSVCHH